jgi:hypothetical protein
VSDAFTDAPRTRHLEAGTSPNSIVLSNGATDVNSQAIEASVRSPDPDHHDSYWPTGRCCSRLSARLCEIGWKGTTGRAMTRISGPMYSTPIGISFSYNNYSHDPSCKQGNGSHNLPVLEGLHPEIPVSFPGPRCPCHGRTKDPGASTRFRPVRRLSIETRRLHLYSVPVTV